MPSRAVLDHLNRLNANQQGQTRKGRVRADGMPVAASFGEIGREIGMSPMATRYIFLTACEKVQRAMAKRGFTTEQVLMALCDEPIQPLEPATDRVNEHSRVTAVHDC